MSTLAKKLRWSDGEWMIHLAWGALAAIHMAPVWRTSAGLISEGASVSKVGIWAALLASFAFFLLKTVDARFLRVRCRKTAIVAFLACCGLAHGGFVTNFAKEHPQQVVTLAVVLAVDTAVLLSPRLRPRLPEFFRRIGEGAAAVWLPRVRYCTLVEEVESRVMAPAGVRRIPPRGPPA